MAGDAYPRVHFPCVVGRPAVSAKTDITRTVLPPLLVGAQCMEHQSQLRLSHPISNGIIQNWDDMEKVWDHAFKDLLKVRLPARRRAYCLAAEDPVCGGGCALMVTSSVVAG